MPGSPQGCWVPTDSDPQGLPKIDPASPEMGGRLLHALQTGRLRFPGTTPHGHITITYVGRGESYAVWRIRQDPTDLVARFPLRELSQMPRSFSAEFEALRFVPPEVGTQPVALIPQEDVLGCPCMVTTYIEGAIKMPDQWLASDLASLADVIARLHQSTSRPVGDFSLDLAADCQQTIDWYAAQHPRIIQGTTAELGHRVLQWLTDHARCMETCRRVALVHGDLVATNVVFAGHQPRLIDWEWAEFTDPAKDLALIGGRISADPWYVPMPPAQVDSFIDAYIEASRKYGGTCDEQVPDSRTDLLERRAVWEICERFGSSLAFSLKAQTEKGTLYRDTVARVHHHLSTVLAEDGY